MTAAPDDGDELVQVNVRLPRSLRDAIDERRSRLQPGPDGRPVSRDAWAARVFTNALRQPMPVPQPNPTAPGMRTAPPPHRRRPTTN